MAMKQFIEKRIGTIMLLATVLVMFGVVGFLIHLRNDETRIQEFIDHMFANRRPRNMENASLLSSALDSDYLGPPMHCMDMRWGKCEEHGEWWALGGRIVGATATGYFTRAIVLICPRGHYIEREIEGPKP